MVTIAASFAAFAIMFILAEIVFVAELSDTGWYKHLPKIAAAIVCFPIVIGILMLVRWLKAKHLADPFYIVVFTARIGHGLWALLTTFVCMLGFAFLLSGVSPLSGGVAAFSLAFIAIGLGLSERPNNDMMASSLSLLKRIANWQLVAGSAVIALVYETPKSNASLFSQLGDNRGLMFALMILWVVGAGGLTILLEPLKYKLDTRSEKSETP